MVQVTGSSLRTPRSVSALKSVLLSDVGQADDYRLRAMGARVCPCARWSSKHTIRIVESARMPTAAGHVHDEVRRQRHIGGLVAGLSSVTTSPVSIKSARTLSTSAQTTPRYGGEATRLSASLSSSASPLASDVPRSRRCARRTPCHLDHHLVQRGDPSARCSRIAGGLTKFCSSPPALLMTSSSCESTQKKVPPPIAMEARPLLPPHRGRSGSRWNAMSGAVRTSL